MTRRFRLLTRLEAMAWTNLYLRDREAEPDFQLAMNTKEKSDAG